MIRLYLDTEFTNLNPLKQTRLISIGLVSPAGHEFYRELSDTYNESVCSDFVIKNVLPYLKGGDCVRTEFQVATELFEFISDLSQNHEQVVIVADSKTDFDFTYNLLFDVANFEGEFPYGNPIGFEFIRRLKGTNTFTVLFNEGLRECRGDIHNALDDAKANMYAHQKILELKS
jgi:hypothetical protein